MTAHSVTLASILHICHLGLDKIKQKEVTEGINEYYYQRFFDISLTTNNSWLIVCIWLTANARHRQHLLLQRLTVWDSLM